ncbi:hypothetical protein [Amycolatopsis sp. lyj-23]|uniref:hypothetical protein n=1 Tax=Amycolatopsis sp. lyj-23 TaxID=2789283 RepID=UPI00397A66A5
MKFADKRAVRERRAEDVDLAEASLPTDEEHSVEGTATTRKKGIPEIRVLPWSAWLHGDDAQLQLFRDWLVGVLEDGNPSLERRRGWLRVHDPRREDVRRYAPESDQYDSHRAKPAHPPHPHTLRYRTFDLVTERTPRN